MCLPTSSVKFPRAMMAYKLAPPLSTKFSNFSKFENDLDLDLSLTRSNVYRANPATLLLTLQTLIDRGIYRGIYKSEKMFFLENFLLRNLNTKTLSLYI